jgi:hypothetical protein
MSGDVECMGSGGGELENLLTSKTVYSNHPRPFRIEEYFLSLIFGMFPSFSQF